MHQYELKLCYKYTIPGLGLEKSVSIANTLFCKPISLCKHYCEKDSLSLNILKVWLNDRLTCWCLSKFCPGSVPSFVSVLLAFRRFDWQLWQLTWFYGHGLGVTQVVVTGKLKFLSVVTQSRCLYLCKLEWPFDMLIKLVV